MKQRIAAGAIVVHDDKILLVNHKKDHVYDFWVAPGGGVIGTETLEDAAIREVREETGLAVSVGKLMYIEEFWQPNQREVKFWFCCQYQGGSIDVSAEEAQSEHIVDARFMSKSEISAITVYPLPLAERIWDDLKNDQFSPHYLGLAEMKVY